MRIALAFKDVPHSEALDKGYAKFMTALHKASPSLYRLMMKQVKPVRNDENFTASPQYSGSFYLGYKNAQYVVKLAMKLDDGKVLAVKQITDTKPEKLAQRLAAAFSKQDAIVVAMSNRRVKASIKEDLTGEAPETTEAFLGPLKKLLGPKKPKKNYKAMRERPMTQKKSPGSEHRNNKNNAWGRPGYASTKAADQLQTQYDEFLAELKNHSTTLHKLISAIKVQRTKHGISGDDGNYAIVFSPATAGMFDAEFTVLNLFTKDTEFLVRARAKTPATLAPLFAKSAKREYPEAAKKWRTVIDYNNDLLTTFKSV